MKKINLAKVIFNQQVKNIYQTAKKAAIKGSKGVMGAEHILLAIIIQKNSSSFDVLDKFGLTQDFMIQKIKEYWAFLKPKVNYGEILFTPSAMRIWSNDYSFCFDTLNQDAIYLSDILIMILNEEDSNVTHIFKAAKIDRMEVLEDLLIKKSIGKKAYSKWRKKNPLDPLDLDYSTRIEIKSRPLNYPKIFVERKNGILSKYSTDLTDLARKGKIDPLLGRKNEIDHLTQILLRRRKNNAILIGEPGVGKTAIAEGLALRIASSQITDLLLKKKIILLNLTSLMAGTQYRGDLEERVKMIIDEVKYDPNIILFIDEIHTIVNTSDTEGSGDIAQLLKPVLARGDFQCIGATTNEEYDKYFKKDPALARRFQIVKIPEPTVKETIGILYGLRKTYEQYHDLSITDSALVSASELSFQFIKDRFLPDKAIDLIDEASAGFRIFNVKVRPSIRQLVSYRKNLRKVLYSAVINEHYGKAKGINRAIIEINNSINETLIFDETPEKLYFVNPVVTVDDISKIVSRWSGIPVDKISNVESQQLLNLEETLHTRIIGQKVAVKAIAKAIIRSRVGLKSDTRPIASFIFAGPTGVGKTELAKALSFFVFGSESAMVRLDMSEYMESFSISKLIGSPPGYVGYSEGGILTSQVKKNPYTVVLFDEIEKGHLDIFNILLQILEDGRLTDSQSCLIDFTNTLIILTSNIGASAIEKIQKNFVPKKFAWLYIQDPETDPLYLEMAKAVKEELKEKFRPEFLNRLDDIIIFQPLTQDDIRKITDIMVGQIIKRIEESFNIYLLVEKQVKDKLAIEGFDPIYGARPLRRAITKFFEDELTVVLLKENYPKGTILKVLINSKNRIIFEYGGLKEIETNTLKNILKQATQDQINKSKNPYINKNINKKF
jgi:ATP-dependent Clp protease ATP-binding subunit ClpC